LNRVARCRVKPFVNPPADPNPLVSYLGEQLPKTFGYFGFGSPGETEAEFAKFFGSFFSKKNCFLLLALARRWTIQPTWAVTKNFSLFGCGFCG
jgi:hypothetical protein